MKKNCTICSTYVDEWDIVLDALCSDDATKNKEMINTLSFFRTRIMRMETLLLTHL